MENAIIALAASATLLAYAIATSRQTALLAAVVSYAAVVSWIVHNDLDLLMPALGVAIMLGVAGLSAAVYREILSQDEALLPARRRIDTNSHKIIQNIGS